MSNACGGSKHNMSRLAWPDPLSGIAAVCLHNTERVWPRDIIEQTYLSPLRQRRSKLLLYEKKLLIPRVLFLTANNASGTIDTGMIGCLSDGGTSNHGHVW